jgi:hypothetical protein
LLLDLVAMRITDVHVHAKWTAGSPAGAPLASGARFSSRHCKGAPATPFPPLQMISITTSPINWLLRASLRSNTGKIPQTFDRQASPTDRPAVDPTEST